MKAFILGLGLAGIISASALAAKPDPLMFRRTLFAPVGQKTLLLEAPVGMCFLDPSYFTQSLLFRGVQDVLDGMDGGILLGVFAPCMEVAGYDAGAAEPMTTVGIVTWLNPTVGETVDMDMKDYLDMQEAKFRDGLDAVLGEKGAPQQGDPLTYVTVDASGTSPAHAALMLPVPGEYRFDAKARRTDSGVLASYTAEFERDSVSYSATGVSSTTVVKNTPIAIHLNQTQKEKPDAEKLRALAEVLVAQQVALNRETR